MYEKNRSHCGARYKLAQTSAFIRFAVNKMQKDHWSPDAVCGYAKAHKRFEHARVCTKTLYHYIDLGLLPIKNIDQRGEFGHWEIDTVLGSRMKGAVLLTLTERKARREHILKIDQKNTASVKKAMQDLKHAYGPTFSQVFKSITSDNGSEFSELSHALDSEQFKVYYTHPYTSSERGTNERHNGLIVDSSQGKINKAHR